MACQPPGNGSPPGKAQGFRGQDTVERHDGLDVIMEKVLQWEQENPASNGREMIKLANNITDTIMTQAMQAMSEVAWRPRASGRNVDCFSRIEPRRVSEG